MPKNKSMKEDNKKFMEIEIAFPECVCIELVQSNRLRNYEMFMLLDSLFISAATGFWVAFASAPFNNILFGVSIVFTLFSLVFIGLAFYYRKKMNNTKIKKRILVEDFK